MTPHFFTLWDFCFQQNRLADYPSLLSQEHNKRYAVRLLADTHPKIPSESFAYLNLNEILDFAPKL